MYFHFVKESYFLLPIGVQFQSVSGILRGVLFCVKSKCAVFYFVWHTLELDTYRNWRVHIFRILIIVFPFCKRIIFPPPYRCPIPECVGHLARCLIQCDTLCFGTPNGIIDSISLSKSIIIFCHDTHIVFVPLIGVQ